MILGLPTSTYTLIHVIISLAGIVSGFIVIFGLIGGRRFNRWTAFFLFTTILTSVTGFGFPIHKIGPPHIVGIISLIVLAIALLARYRYAMQGRWRSTYVITAVVAQYFNVFVLVVQLFDKVAALHRLAPHGNEPPFAIAQAGVLIVFIALGIFANSRSRGVALQPA